MLTEEQRRLAADNYVHVLDMAYERCRRRETEYYALVLDRLTDVLIRCVRRRDTARTMAEFGSYLRRGLAFRLVRVRTRKPRDEAWARRGGLLDPRRREVASDAGRDDGFEDLVRLARTERRREVLRLVYAEDLGYREVAARLGIAEVTAFKDARRARGEVLRGLRRCG